MENRRGQRLDSVFEIIVGDSRTGAFVGRVVNVSEDGLYIVRREPLKNGTVMHLRMDLPADFCETPTVRFKAQVRWSEVVEDPPQYGVGLQILEFGNGLRSVLRHLMKMTCFDR